MDQHKVDLFRKIVNSLHFTNLECCSAYSVNGFSSLVSKYISTLGTPEEQKRAEQERNDREIMVIMAMTPPQLLGATPPLRTQSSFTYEDAHLVGFSDPGRFTDRFLHLLELRGWNVLKLGKGAHSSSLMTIIIPPEKRHTPPEQWIKKAESFISLWDDLYTDTVAKQKAQAEKDLKARNERMKKVMDILHDKQNVCGVVETPHISPTIS
jgi:hypothetical protein